MLVNVSVVVFWVMIPCGLAGVTSVCRNILSPSSLNLEDQNVHIVMD
jgi:hypothetical protein